MIKVFLDNGLINETGQYLGRFKKKCLISNPNNYSKRSEPWDIVVLSESSFDKTTSIEKLKEEFPFCGLFFLPSTVYSPKIHREDVIVFSDTNTLVNNLITILSFKIEMAQTKRQFEHFSIYREPVFSGDSIKPFLSKLRGLKNGPLHLMLVAETGSQPINYAKFLYPQSRIDIVDCADLKEESLRLFLEGDKFKKGFLQSPHQCVFFSEISNLSEDDLIYLYSMSNKVLGPPFIASCAADEKERVKGVFDLYETVEIPPLRERKSDIPCIINDLISQMAQENNLKVNYPTTNTIQMCQIYSWPGNYTELRKFTHDYCLNGSIKTLKEFFKGIEIVSTQEQLPEYNAFQKKLRNTVEEIFVKKVMEITQNNRKKAASLLGISYKSLSKKIKLYNDDSGV